MSTKKRKALDDANPSSKRRQKLVLASKPDYISDYYTTPLKDAVVAFVNANFPKTKANSSARSCCCIDQCYSRNWKKSQLSNKTIAHLSEQIILFQKQDRKMKFDVLEQCQVPLVNTFARCSPIDNGDEKVMGMKRFFDSLEDSLSTTTTTTTTPNRFSNGNIKQTYEDYKSRSPKNCAPFATFNAFWDYKYRHILPCVPFDVKDEELVVDEDDNDDLVVGNKNTFDNTTKSQLTKIKNVIQQLCPFFTKEELEKETTRKQECIGARQTPKIEHGDKEQCHTGYKNDDDANQQTCIVC